MHLDLGLLAWRDLFRPVPPRRLEGGIHRYPLRSAVLDGLRPRVFRPAQQNPASLPRICPAIGGYV